MNLAHILFNRAERTFHVEGDNKSYDTAGEAIVAWENMHCDVAWLGSARLVGNAELRLVVHTKDCWVTVDPMDGCWVVAVWEFEPTTESHDEAMLFVLDDKLSAAVAKITARIVKMSKLLENEAVRL